MCAVWECGKELVLLCPSSQESTGGTEMEVFEVSLNKYMLLKVLGNKELRVGSPAHTVVPRLSPSSSS